MHPAIMSRCSHVGDGASCSARANAFEPSQSATAAAQRRRRAAAEATSAYVASWRASVPAAAVTGAVSVLNAAELGDQVADDGSSHDDDDDDDDNDNDRRRRCVEAPLAPALRQRGSAFSRTRSSGASSSDILLPADSSSSSSASPADASQLGPAGADGCSAPALHPSASSRETSPARDNEAAASLRESQVASGGNCVVGAPAATEQVAPSAPASATADGGEGKRQLAERMVDSVQSLICSIWPSAREHDAAAPACPPLTSAPDERCGSPAASEASSGSASGLVPLRAFIREILRRSKSSCGTLKCAEWYLTQLRDAWHPTSGQNAGRDLLAELPADSPIICPRRAFLSALILAHKFLHDRVYSNRAWAKVSGLDVREISRGELALAVALEHRLWFCKPDIQEPAEDKNPLAFAVGAHDMKRSSSVPSSSVSTLIGRPVAPSLVPARKPMASSRLSGHSSTSSLLPLSPQTASQDSHSSMSLSGSMPGLTLDSKSSSEWDEASSPSSAEASGAACDDAWVHVSAGVQIVTSTGDDVGETGAAASGAGKKRLTLSDAHIASITDESAHKKRKVETASLYRAILPHL